jgi:YD repeat-containing protein
MIARQLLCAALCIVAAFVGASLQAATATYTYDALGRLTQVRYDTGKVAIYYYDQAGNRDRVVTGTITGVPASIAVPASSTTGSYTISWGVSTGTVTAYQLFEATNPSFTGATLLYTGTARSRAISGRLNGTYYYRVRSCIDVICSNYRTGTRGVVVTRP